MRFLLAIIFACAAPAYAQDRPPQGIGFAQAEEGTWLCRHERAEEALACARELCAEQAPGQECWSTRWCFPSGWSGMMVVWLSDFHFTETLCGAPTEAALNEALRSFCIEEDSATHCELTMIVDPEGNERAVEGRSFPGPVAPPEEAEVPAEGEGEEAGGAPAEPNGP